MSDICRRSDFFECHLAVTLWKICAPLFLIIGVPGNIASLMVLSKPRMRKTTTSVCLRLLAIVDTAILLIALPRQIALFYSSLKLSTLSTFHCKFYGFLSPALTTLSWTFMPVITLDRYIQVRYPIWAKTRSTRRSALIVFAVLASTVFTLNFHTVLFLTIPRREVTVSNNHTNTTFEVIGTCSPVSEWYGEFYTTTWMWIVVILFNLVPLTVHIVGNLLLIRNLVKRSNRRQAQRAVEDANEKEQKDLKSMTRMLIVVCLFFIVTSAPQCSRLLLKNYTFKPRSPHNVAKDMLFKTFVQILMYSNNAVNFLLYTLSGRVFRKELFSMLTDIGRRVLHCCERNDVYPITTTTTTAKQVTSSTRTGPT